MSKNETITIEIMPGGNASIETSGFKGKACEEVTSQLKKALGKTTSTKKKSEYFETPDKLKAKY